MHTRHGRATYFHRAVEAGGVLYCSGLTADDTTADLKGQTLQVLSKLRGLLRELGSDTSKILMATAYITDMSTKEQMNEAWLEFFAPDELPARATIGVASLGSNILIEVVCQAAA